MGETGFPITVEDITADWLTDTLRTSGALSQGRVTGFTATPLGAGVGFMSAMRRLSLSYDDPAGGGPASLIAKLPPPDPGSRTIDEAFNFYEKEVGFYRHIAPSTPMRTPRAYFSAYDPTTRDFAVLLEDLAPRQIGDQLEGLSAERLVLALKGAAGLHGRWWRDPSLLGMDWLLGMDSPQMRQLQPIYQQCWPAVVDFLGPDMPAEMRRIGDRFATRIVPLLGVMLAQPMTVVHGDYRADNLFFSASGEAEGFAVADWQICLKGGGALDIAYLLTGSVDIGVRRSNEADLLGLYHRTLFEHGGRDYPLETFREDYIACVMLAWCWPVIAIGSLDTANDRGVALFRAWASRATTAVLDLDAQARIP
jgi:Ecdysteroid kinase-like family